MPRHFKVNDLLNDQELAECRALATTRSSTVDGVWAWLRKRGHKVSRSAVHNWMFEVRTVAESPVAQMRSDLHRHVDGLSEQDLTMLHESVFARDSRAARVSSTPPRTPADRS